METQPVASDARLLRAARSLYTNRTRQQIIEARIERATDALMAHLGLYRLTAVTLGFYQVELVDGQLQLTKHETNGATQLPLPEADRHDPTLAVAALPETPPAPHAQP